MEISTWRHNIDLSMLESSRVRVMFRGKRKRQEEEKEKPSSSRKRTRFVTPINPSQYEGLSQEEEPTSATVQHPAAPSHEPLLNDSLDILASLDNSSTNVS